MRAYMLTKLFFLRRCARTCLGRSVWFVFCVRGCVSVSVCVESRYRKFIFHPPDCHHRCFHFATIIIIAGAAEMVQRASPKNAYIMCSRLHDVVDSYMYRYEYTTHTHTKPSYTYRSDCREFAIHSAEKHTHTHIHLDQMAMARTST